jgi:cytoskeleton protein RodZ
VNKDPELTGAGTDAGAAAEQDVAAEQAGEGGDAAPGPALHFGEQIARARESAGMTVATLAAKLRIHSRQVDAIERADLEQLPARSYVRGFVRACARELRIDPAPLLADLESRLGPDPSLSVPSGPNRPRVSSFGENARPIVLALLALLVVAGLVGWLVPRHRAGAAVGPAVPGSGSGQVATPAPAPVPADPMAAPSGVEVPTTPPVAAPAASAPVAPAAAAAGPAPAPAAGSSAPAGNPAAPAANTAVPAKLPAPGAAAPAAPAASLAPDEARLELEFQQAAWVQVVREDGAVVFQQLCAAGTRQVITGRPPMTATIGNATAVRARYRGKELDLATIAGTVGVAKLNLP